MNSSPRRRVQQRGSALLIVFLFAAVVAIMLYSEMPVTAFEARRQKEQLLIDRANEYKHAVKLYYRKVGGYPADIKQLESTNRMRFLRHRYKDPFTDKDDWRLVHMGPGNMLLDSKIKKNAALAGTGAPTSGNSSVGGASSFSGNSNTASTSSFGSGSNSSSSFGSNMGGFTGLSSSDSQPTVKVPPVRQRGPAVPAGAGGSEDSEMPADTSAGNAIPMPPEMPAPETPSNAMPAAGQASPSGAVPNGGQPGSNSGTPTQNPTQMVQGLFGSQSPRQGMSTSSSSGTMHGGGGIAGVASRASGESIKSINDQTDYSLWEFYYDPSKDVQPGLGGAAGGTATSVGTGSATPTTQPAGSTNPNGQTSNFFSSSTFSSGSSFGSSSTSNSGSPSPSGRSAGAAQNTPQQ